MPSQYGASMMQAMRAVSEMHDDCIRLFHALDKELPQLKPVYNMVTFEQGQTIARRSYLAEILLRHYAAENAPDHVLGITLCLFDPWTAALDEPILVVTNTVYTPGSTSAAENSKRYWDPWQAWLKWLCGKEYYQAHSLDKLERRPTVEHMTVAAAPLATVTSIEGAMTLVDLTGWPRT